LNKLILKKQIRITNSFDKDDFDELNKLNARYKINTGVSKVAIKQCIWNYFSNMYNI